MLITTHFYDISSENSTVPPAWPAQCDRLLDNMCILDIFSNTVKKINLNFKDKVQEQTCWKNFQDTN